MITVRDICKLFTETFQSIEIWSVEKNGTLFIGIVDDLLDTEYADAVVQSIDALSKATRTITINV